jgi:hypothetical protein
MTEAASSTQGYINGAIGLNCGTGTQLVITPSVIKEWYFDTVFLTSSIDVCSSAKVKSV